MIGIVLLCACGLALVQTARDDVGPHGQRTTPTSVAVVAPSRTTAPTQTATARPAQPSLPSGAIGIATKYALLTFSTTAGVSTDAWINAVTPICTLAWRDHLSAAMNIGEVASATDRPRVVHVFVSWAPRGEVGATVLLVHGPNGGYEAIYLDLKRIGDRYRVAAAQ